jgi:hypothetical protein
MTKLLPHIGHIVFEMFCTITGVSSTEERTTVFTNPQQILQKPEREAKEIESESYRGYGYSK